MLYHFIFVIHSVCILIVLNDFGVPLLFVSLAIDCMN